MSLRDRIQDGLWWIMPERETIGAPDCPLMYRWTLLDRCDMRLMVHYFLPNAADPDCHDHPRPFITAILRGSYEDIVPCHACRGTGQPASVFEEDAEGRCFLCNGVSKIVAEVMRPGMIRRRSARHAHLTRTGDEGCWTLVLMGPKRRPWGFLRSGRWWPFREYGEVFGFHMRCDSESGELVRSARAITLADIDAASRWLGAEHARRGDEPLPPDLRPPRPPEPPDDRPVS